MVDSISGMLPGMAKTKQPKSPAPKSHEHNGPAENIDQNNAEKKGKLAGTGTDILVEKPQQKVGFSTMTSFTIFILCIMLTLHSLHVVRRGLMASGFKALSMQPHAVDTITQNDNLDSVFSNLFPLGSPSISPTPLMPEAPSQVSLVWSSGWITCMATALGALPFFCFDSVGNFSVGLSNAIAAGMMFSASMALVIEAAKNDGNDGRAAEDTTFVPGFWDVDFWCWDASVKVIFGIWAGVGFIRITEHFFGDFDFSSSLVDAKTSSNNFDFKRLILIFAVMTLHSFAEGVAVGVSFHSASLASYITTTLAIHNIPEGLALSIVLIPRHISKTTTMIFCILSSLPQPIMAVPAYLFVDVFRCIVPIGLGFAAGAMLFVAIFELFIEAKEILGLSGAFIVSGISSIGMIWLQTIVS